MSWVAEVNPTIQNTASVRENHSGVGSAKAMPAKAAAMSHCMVRVQRRLVLMMSTKGLQKGLMTHGR